MARKFSQKTDVLNYTVDVSENIISKYPTTDLNSKSVVGIWPQKPNDKIVLFTPNAPAKFVLGETKRQPSKVLTTTKALVSGAKIASIDVLNKGAQILLTLGYPHKEDKMLYKPLVELQFEGMYIDFYRNFMYRYDKLKNDNFLEVSIVLPKNQESGETAKLLTLFFPTPSPATMRTKNMVWLEESLKEFFTWSQSKEANPTVWRTFLYKKSFNGKRKDSDFTDKSTKSYVSFNDLRDSFVEWEKRLGNTALSVFMGWSFWYWTQINFKIETSIMGYYQDKYLNTLTELIQEVEYPKKQDIYFGTVSEE